MNLHGKIMNLRCPLRAPNGDTPDQAYRQGHKIARHAAAELALRADALADELREVLEWARVEKAPLREQEIASIRRALAEYEA